MSAPRDEQLGLFGEEEDVRGSEGAGNAEAGAADRATREARRGSETRTRNAAPPLASDAAARRRAQTELRRPLLVEAGAGTGKTTTLTARILSWCLGPGWELGVERVAERDAAARPLAVPAPPDPEAVAAETLGRVVAITFTEAAAAEMASRMGQALAHLAAGQPAPPWLLEEGLPSDPERSLRARALLGGLDHLVVRTIHAFCRGLLAAHPLEAGLHPDLQVDPDGFRVEEIAREVVEDRLRQGYGDPGDPDLLALAGRGIGPAELVEAVVDALVREGLRPEDLESPPLAPERTAGLRSELAAAVDRFEEAAGGRLDGLARGRKADEVMAAVRAAGAAARETGSFDALCSTLSDSWEDSTRGRLREWVRGRFNKTEGDALAQGGAPPDAVAEAAAGLLDSIDRLRSLDPDLLERSRRVLGPLLAAVRERMRVAGLATFHDLLAGARDLLARRPDVAGRVRRRIDQLLVDELQDTDRLQVEVISAIALDGPEETRPGLFLVGDPKQSIYGWRNADLRAYEELWERVRAAGGEKLVLVENFRSVPAILDEVTRAVEPVMREEPGLQPAFEPLVACERLAGEAGFVRGRWAAVEYWVSWLPEEGDGVPALGSTRAGDATREEAEGIARDLARLKTEEGVAWGDAALLLRSFSDLDDYLEALRREGVPFAVTGDRQYYRRREVIDAAALVRTVLDPGDHLALLTVLRSPAVGVPDAALLPLWREGFPSRMTELGGAGGAGDGPALEQARAAVEAAAARMPPEEEVPGLDRVRGWEKTLLAAVEAIATLRRSFAEDPADRFVERLRRLVPLDLMASARHLGRYRLANLDRFFRRLAEAMESSAGDVTAMLRALRRGVSEALEEEEGRPATESGDGEAEAAEDAVRVMTIHKAKGLDFGHVYLGQLHKTSPRSGLPWIAAGRARGDGDQGQVEYCLFGAPTPGFHEVREEMRRVEAAERVRTLYVAMTRAKQRMVLAGRWPELPRGVQPEEASSYLDLLGHRFSPPPELGDLWAEGAERAGRLDRHGVRWVFPHVEGGAEAGAGPRAGAGTEAGGGSAGASASPEGLPDPERVASESDRLLALRREAAERSERPFGRPASPGDDRSSEDGRPQPEGSEQDQRVDNPVERRVAQIAGTAVHQILEDVDLSGRPTAAELGERLATACDDPITLLPSELSDDLRVSVSEKVAEIMEQVLAGDTTEKLAEIAAEVLVRELPVLITPDEESSESPVGYWSGTIDLVYTDPETGDLVVADYKTNQIETESELERKTHHYAPQLRLYARALQEALALPDPPRAELWFLWPGRVMEVA